MTKIKLISTAYHVYDSRQLKPGDPFEAVAKDAAVLKHLGRATPAAEVESEQPEPEPEPQPEPEPKRYHRRDMRPAK